jgi:hypothetical protein
MTIGRKQGWNWMIERIEKRTKLWCNRWISLEDKFTLVKSSLEEIILSLHSMAFIQKRVFESIRNKCFKFSWISKCDKYGIPLVK